MPNTFKVLASGLLSAVLLAVSVAAQQPPISNGRVTPQAAGSPFAQSFHALVSSLQEVTWIGYSVPAADREGTVCCGMPSGSSFDGSMADGSCCASCRLEPGEGATSATRSSTPAGPVRLEGSGRISVLFRVADRRVDRIRVFPEDCQLDAGGRPVRWLENVRPTDSVGLLESLVGPEPDRKDRTSSSALTAIALHAEPAAGATLVRLAQAHGSTRVRGDALFWLAHRHDTDSQKIILAALDRDPAPEVRKKAVFALTQLGDGGVAPLLQVARSHAEPSVRGEAIFWLGQKAGRKAAEAITERIEQDPDTEVKKRAVFALGQLPKDEGIPLLIKVARTNTNAVVRKQAIFWLGQSRDQRALDFFAEILK